MSEIPPPPIEEPEVVRIPRPPEQVPSGPMIPHRRLALTIAIVADTLQWVAFPFFMPGIASPVNNALDIAVALVMFRLVGFHWAFLPAFVAELIPFMDLVPSWTAAVWLATRSKR